MLAARQYASQTLATCVVSVVAAVRSAVQEPCCVNSCHCQHMYQPTPTTHTHTHTLTASSSLSARNRPRYSSFSLLLSLWLTPPHSSTTQASHRCLPTVPAHDSCHPSTYPRFIRWLCKCLLVLHLQGLWPPNITITVDQQQYALHEATGYGQATVAHAAHAPPRQNCTLLPSDAVAEGMTIT